MKNCICGKEVRLGAMKISVNRKRGVTNYILHMDGSKVCVPGDWTSVMMKPYPMPVETRPSRMLIRKWNERI